jgi:hypothetical protein
MNLYHYLKSKLSRKFKFTKTNELSFLRQYIYDSAYSKDNVVVKENLSDILDRFKRIINNDNGVMLESKFNNYYYPFFDLDTQEKLDLFKLIHKKIGYNYAIFKSSTDHYWGIVDTPYKNLTTIFTDHNWKICNDPNYVSYSVSGNILSMRGLYETEERKPRLFETNGTFSYDFQLFINMLVKYFNVDALELSVLRYKDPIMLMKFNRKRKLRQLKNIQNKD